MNRKEFRLLCLIGEVDAKYIQEEKTVSRKPIWIAGLSVAACAAVVIVAMAFMNFQKPSSVICLQEGDVSEIEDTSQTQKKEPSFFETSITQPANPSIFLSDGLACYLHGPRAGEVFVEHYSLIEEQIKKNGSTIINICYEDGNSYPVNYSEKKYADLDRLKALGYELYVNDTLYEDYWGTPRKMTYVRARVNLEQLLQFPAGDTFGYTIMPRFTSSIPDEDYIPY